MGNGKEKMIALILILALGLRLIGLNQSLWLDEGINIMAAKSFSFWGLLTQYAPADFHPPLWFALLWVWGKLFGYAEAVLRLTSVFFGIATVYFTYLIGKKLVSKKAGLLTALLLAVNPLHIYYSQEARMYALAALAVSVNMFLFLKILKGEKVNFLLFVLSNLFILVSDYIAYFIFPAQFVYLLLLRKKEILKKWFLALGGAVVLNFWWWPVFISQLDVGAVASERLPTWKFVAGGFDAKSLPLTFVKFIIGRISLANKMLYFAVLLPVVSLFAYLIFRGIRNLETFGRRFVSAWLFLPIAGAALVSFIIPVYSYFRVIYLIPAFAIFISAGILSFKKFRYIIPGLVLLIELSSVFLYLIIPSNQREDWKGVVNFFKSTNPDALILLESSGTFPPFEYYSEGKLLAKGALKDFPATDESSTENLPSVIGDKDELYLIDYMVQISDPKRLAAKKITELGFKEAETYDFHGVGFVYHYVKK